MWLATKVGFFSVAISTVDGRAQFRARGAGDLDELRALLGQEGVALSETLTIKADDYRHRAFIERKDLAAAFSILAETVDYANFKSEIARHPSQCPKLNAYREVWAALHRIQD